MSGNFGSLIVPGDGAVLPDVGRIVAGHTSTYVDSVRVRRTDEIVSTAGNFTFWRLADACPSLT